ncbi:MAG: nucleotidyltransferase family protein [Burkholderiales bacterium]|nr:nucleotidyltransferase family protein [Burkholderiales bacterium]
MRIAGILLAAGSGVRFGGGKLMAPLPAAAHGVSAGTPIGAAAAMHMMAALNDVIAVVRPRDPALSQALEATGARVVVCESASEGMGASLACAVGAATDADGWIVALGDMPWIAPPTIAAVADAIKGGAEIAAPAYRGQRGHPVGFARAYGRALCALTGDEGARTIVAARRWVLQTIEVDDPGCVRDVDLPADLRRGQGHGSA